MSISRRSFFVFLFDLCAAAAALLGGMWLRFNFEWWPDFTRTALLCLLFLLPLHAGICRWAGLYRGLWVFASLPDLKRLLKAVLASTAVMILFAVLWRPYPAVPRSMVVLYPAILILIMGGGRAVYRMWKEHRLFGGLLGQGKPVLIIGAGRAAAMLARELERSPDWRVIGFLDDDAAKWGRELGGLRIFGGLNALPELAEQTKAQHAILAMPSAAPEARRRVADLGSRAGITLLTVPGLEDIMDGRVSAVSMRRVEIDDLLGRDIVSMDTHELVKAYSDKAILVTGAGGSIGSELCRQLARFAPARLILLDHSEFALYAIEQWFAQHQPHIAIVCIAADVKDTALLEQLFAAQKPELVFHAAAYKHVPLMEVGNAWTAVRNNVGGTLAVARTAQRHGAERFVLVSTDKAVNPTNVMGATKRMAEMVCQCLQAQGGEGGTRFAQVRFGNVLGSAGSVIPKFQEQIARGGPVTVTHPEITRYFMSIPEAALLVLQAGCMGRGGEIYVLEMGEPVKIVDLARNMIRLSGFAEQDIRIEYTGLRPGEKLYEELLADAEATLPTPHPKLRIAQSRCVPGTTLDEVVAWLQQQPYPADEAVRRELRRWVPEYAPSERPALSVLEGGRAA